MSDKSNNRRPSDSSRVNVNESWELNYWSRRFGISPEELKSTVGRVGVMVKDIESYLGR